MVGRKWHTSFQASSLYKELVFEALDIVAQQRDPEDVYHSDRGVQHTAIGLGRCCGDAIVRPFMGATGDWYNDATWVSNSLISAGAFFAHESL
jgi:transposase InsO family protein